VISLGFGVLGTLGSGGRDGGVILVLRTFPKLVWRSIQNWVGIGLAGHMWKRDTDTYIGTNSLFWIYKLKDKTDRSYSKGGIKFEGIAQSSQLRKTVCWWIGSFFIRLGTVYNGSKMGRHLWMPSRRVCVIVYGMLKYLLDASEWKEAWRTIIICLKLHFKMNKIAVYWWISSFYKKDGQLTIVANWVSILGCPKEGCALLLLGC